MRGIYFMHCSPGKGGETMSKGTYRTEPVFLDDMGSISSFHGLSDKPSETKEEEALWHLNAMRDHDGLNPLQALPDSFIFKHEGA